MVVKGTVLGSGQDFAALPAIGIHDVARGKPGHTCDSTACLSGFFTLTITAINYVATPKGNSSDGKLALNADIFISQVGYVGIGSSLEAVLARGMMEEHTALQLAETS
jgi:hypothetical protein